MEIKKNIISILIYLLKIVLEIIFIYIYIFFVIKISNICTKYISNWIKSPIILITFHIFIICIFYDFISNLITYFEIDIAFIIIIIGPMIGSVSDYFTPFTKLLKNAIDGNKKKK